MNPKIVAFTEAVEKSISLYLNTYDKYPTVLYINQDVLVALAKEDDLFNYSQFKKTEMRETSPLITKFYSLVGDCTLDIVRTNSSRTTLFSVE